MSEVIRDLLTQLEYDPYSDVIVDEIIEEVKSIEQENINLQDKLSDYDYNLVSRFDKDAAEHTDAYTYITSLLYKIECLEKENSDARRA